MTERMDAFLGREAEEAEERADAEEEGLSKPLPGHRPRRSSDASQVYSVRLPHAAIAELKVIAERYNEAPTALLRRFVLERLETEARGAAPVDAVGSAVDDLLTIVRERLLEQVAALSVSTDAGLPLQLTKSTPSSGVVNLGPSRRRAGTTAVARRGKAV
jgi:hypothetical protein